MEQSNQRSDLKNVRNSEKKVQNSEIKYELWEKESKFWHGSKNSEINQNSGGVGDLSSKKKKIQILTLKWNVWD